MGGKRSFTKKEQWLRIPKSLPDNTVLPWGAHKIIGYRIAKRIIQSPKKRIIQSPKTSKQIRYFQAWVPHRTYVLPKTFQTGSKYIIPKTLTKIILKQPSESKPWRFLLYAYSQNYANKLKEYAPKSYEFIMNFDYEHNDAIKFSGVNFDSRMGQIHMAAIMAKELKGK